MKNCRIYFKNATTLEAKTYSTNSFTTSGELVFTTSMTGYQEVITDPSFAGQIVTMTYPIIGNYGISNYWNQSEKIHAKAIIVANATCNGGFLDFLRKNKVPLVLFDTRDLVQLIRKLSYPKCVISTKELSAQELETHYSTINTNIVSEISTKKIKTVVGNAKNGKKIGILDFGVKSGIVKELQKYFSQIYILPHRQNYKETQKLALDALLLSNGAGNPEVLAEVIENIKHMLGKIPIYGICLGHQLLGLALGCKTKAMSFGHRGSNHPVINTETRSIIITSQNHGYEIAEDSVTEDVLITYRNIHDGSIEGIKSIKHNSQSVQFHPEGCPGPNDAKVIFSEWFNKFII